MKKLNDYEKVYWLTLHIRQELLGLGDRIGHVGTSLLDKIIARQMRTKTYILLDNLEGSTSQKQKIDLCIICQVSNLVSCIDYDSSNTLFCRVLVCLSVLCTRRGLFIVV